MCEIHDVFCRRMRTDNEIEFTGSYNSLKIVEKRLREEL